MRGLRWQFAWFYLLLAVPALLVVERVAFGWKFEHLLMQLDDGRVEAALNHELASLSVAAGEGARAEELQERLRALVLRLERPRESLQTRAAFVLLELSDHPFQIELRLPGQGAWQAGASELADTAVRREWRVSERAAAQSGSAELILRLAVPSPWRLNMSMLSFEWTLAVAYLLLFLFGSAWFLRRRVLRRIGRIGEAAQSWAAGDFSARLRDGTSDELGQLADDLNRMALDLKTLVEARAELASLSARQQVARDLHDTVKQKVFALSLQLEAARSKDATAAAPCLAEALSLVGEVQTELSEVLLQLRSEIQDPQDIVAPLQQRLQDFSRRSGCSVGTRMLDHLWLSSVQADALLRIADEAVANIWRHAQASRVTVTLELVGTQVCLRIVDNGRGLQGDNAEGMGLSNMRNRAAALSNGDLRVMRVAEGGTCVELRFQTDPESIS